jgi:processive 1,2-diacylglycerol beta-glucosyltransferase
LTDFYPHSYWIYEAIDKYAVASADAKDRLLANGVIADKVYISGIPIDIKFSRVIDKDLIYGKLGLDRSKKTVLVMGGSQGLGPIRRVVFSLDRICSDMQMIVVSGTNNRLYNYLKRRIKKFNKPVALLGYVDNTDELMSIADMIVTKPGGLTVSEALSKSTPIVIVNPIPGQESKNTEFLIKQGAAVKASNEREVAILVENLCSTAPKLEDMKKSAERIARPDSAIDVANMLLEI